VISEAHLDEFVSAIRDVVALADSSPAFGQRLWRWLGAQPKSRQHGVRI
jgi:hypothetical protein